jgi:parvulin-like peptidyl-prolyl isomerase
MRHRRFVLIAAALLAAAVLGSAQKVVEEIVAVVNDDIITLSEVRREYEMRVEAARAQLQGEEFEKYMEQMKSRLLDDLINDMLLLQLAKERNLNVADQVRMTLENVKKQNNLESDDELKRALASQGMEWNAWLKQVEQTSLQQAVIYSEVNRSIVLDDAEIVDYFKKHPDEFVEPEEYTLRAIYLKTLDVEPAEIEARKKDVDAKLAAGEDFAGLAETAGDPPLKDVKGDLGTIKKGQLEATLQKAVDGLAKGGVSGWVETKNGWYLLRLEDKKDRRLPTFDEAKKQIEEKIFLQKQAAKMEEFIRGLKARSFVKILKPNALEDIR